MNADYGRPDQAPLEEALSFFTGRETLPPASPFSKVLVPLDGTSENERTLPYAALLGGGMKVHVSLGYVHVEAGRRSETAEANLIGPEENRRQDMSHVFSYLARLRQQLPAQASSVEALEIGAHSVVEGLLELESSTRADLVLVALPRHSITDHLSLGSVVDTLIQKGSTPVLAIPPRSRESGGKPISVRHILVPLDGSALAEQALAPLLGWLGRTQPEKNTRLAVTLLGIAENHATLPHYQSYLGSLRTVLLGCPECARIPDFQVHAEALVGSMPGALVDVVEQNIFGATFRSEPTDLLIMATHGRGGLGRWVFGSVASHVLPRVHVPVLLLHPLFLDM